MNIPENIEIFLARNLPRPSWCSRETKKKSKFFEDETIDMPDSDKLSDSGISDNDSEESVSRSRSGDHQSGTDIPAEGGMCKYRQYEMIFNPILETVVSFNEMSIFEQDNFITVNSLYLFANILRPILYQLYHVG